ncbi:hypothetical protein [Ferroplasma sp. Type II]|uniref:hypothetical protein n=1 Tax=Ferroplasma sp. Type II TaxID=261388 RepID=UPI0025C605E1|nr:hypothetical protein [Ferroplasma sp. Type II]
MYYTYMLPQSSIYREDLVGYNNLGKSQIFRLKAGRLYWVFVELFYKSMCVYLMVHDLLELKKLENILSV